MKWSKPAEEALSRVPFFVRKRVRCRVEEEATRSGAAEVETSHLNACQRKFLSTMENEIKGYALETCFGSNGCPNRVADAARMADRLTAMLAGKDLKGFLKSRVQGPLKMHHELRLSISDCPNACSRPQIVDCGLIGARRPEVAGSSCSQCGACVEACREEAIELVPGENLPRIDAEKCLSCGQCLAACPTGTLKAAECGYRILLGGRLGRHPKLGRELGRIYSPEQALRIVEACVNHHLAHNQHGERFGEVLARTGMPELPDE